jgi:hypothetical protein
MTSAKVLDHFFLRCVLQKRVEQGAPAIAFTSAVEESIKAWEKQNLSVPHTYEVPTPNWHKAESPQMRAKKK